MVDQVSVTQEMAAPVDRVWAMVSDVTRMGEWSPENESAIWIGGASGLEPGAKFRGTNRNGKKSWNTVSTVMVVEPGSQFSFRVTGTGFKVAEWRYLLEPTATGCRVTETWIDQRGTFVKVMGKPVSGVGDRAAHNRATMEKTLERLKAAAEAETTTG